MIRHPKAEVLYWIASWAMLPHRLRPPLLRLAGDDVPDTALVMDGLRIGSPHGSRGRVTLGEDVFINFDCFIENAAAVSIEQGVRMATRVQILTGTHHVGHPNLRAGKERVAPVTIGCGTWLGAGVTILPGVHVGPGCVIGAGSVVTSDCQANGLYVGAPATRVKDLSGT